MNSLCLEPAPTADFPATVSAVGRGVPAVAAVRNLRPQSGLLACIESIAQDRGRPASQLALLQRFPRRCRRFQSDEGRIEYRDALELMADLGLTDSFETVRDMADVADLGDRIGRGVILAVPAVPGGDPRWWRLAAVQGAGVRVMQPESDDPARFGEVSFAELETAGAWAVALD